jgi:hypothetical protein
LVEATVNTAAAAEVLVPHGGRVIVANSKYARFDRGKVPAALSTETETTSLQRSVTTNR